MDPVLFKFTPEPAGIPVVMLASRLLFDKGVGELVEAARLLKSRGVKCRVALVGEPDPGNPASIPVECLLQWQKEGHTEWWGRRGDMAEVLALANLVVLPSYREGLPKILLEAASCGRAIIAADVPGCREIVIHGKNGILVPVRDPAALAEAVEELLKKPALRAQMGAEGRKLVVKEFSEERVVQETLALYDRLVGKAGAGK
ncbi:MAG: N,N'-diacetylbacillosaminyl-diphospho-undecaprenol alpha-1,3-N-acetylgalactosaminyltransferase [Firmicutes bacterium ADurb.Bin456]|nr:MAG: N,N'-diacetylbacillosaminyl-diphospho-undecaprenol alpha-1,3-N-acetylgalactosaminyltransferase [Firmicutes bacterium ADurb.Bin456]